MAESLGFQAPPDGGSDVSQTHSQSQSQSQSQPGQTQGLSLSSQPVTPIINLQGVDEFPIQQQHLTIDGDRNGTDPGDPAPRSATPCQPSTSPEGPDHDETQNGTSTSPAQLQGPGLLNAPPKVGTRFSSGSVRVLRNWFAGHERHPYPSAEDVENLQNQTGLTRQQITNWLANCRRRSKFQTVRPASPHVRTWGDPLAAGAAPIDIPPRRATPAPMEHMNPLQRWENSPPEHEAALVSDISRAVVAASVVPTPEPRPSRPSGRSSGNASSVSSAGTSRSSRGSGSHASAYSHTSRTSFDSLKRSANRRRRRATKQRQDSSRLSLLQPYNTYQCTFCTETFKTKYDWQRHEKSLHLSLEEWICSPKGSTETHPDKGTLCVYCGDADPDQDHLNGHNHAACLERPFEERTFYRKDHLQQHLKLVHGTKYMKWPMENWQIANKEIRSRCGFCDLQLQSWTSRADHLAEHFKSGSTMANWKGDWGFEPAVIEMVDNAMPPYLIHYEQNSPLPFSAIQGPADTPTSAYELIKLELEYYMRNYFDAHGELPSDEKLQYEACSIIFGAEVISQQSAASAPSWLRDMVMANHEITKQARIRPMKQVAKSRMSQLKINGKANIFENCELEVQLCRHISMHVTLGLSLSDYELQQEACNTVARLETQSLNPSTQFVEFITRLIWDSTEWVEPLKQRGQEFSVPDMADDSPQPMDMVNMDPFLGADFADPQQPQFGFLQQDMSTAAMGLDQPGTDQFGSAMPWTSPMGTANQLHMPTFATSGPSTPHIPSMPGTGTSSPSGMNTPGGGVPLSGGLPAVPDNTIPSGPQHRWVPMPETAFNPGYSSTRAPRQTSVTPFFLNDNNSYRRLARELSRFVASCMSPNNPNSHIPTDDELKYQARWILYDDDDPWNQTPVDNVEWLREFKRDVGLPIDDGQPAVNSVTWS